MLDKLTIEDLELHQRKVFLRVDFNVPLDKGLNVADDFRIRSSLKSIQYLLDGGASLIIASHLGRPKGKRIPELSLKPVAARLSDLLGQDVIMAPDCIGGEVRNRARNLRQGEVMLLENLRYYTEETNNDSEFARSLANLADLYVNDAFGTAHRAHASVFGIASYFETKAAGFLMKREIDYLVTALHSPARPFIVVLGGAKISTKIEIIQNLMEKCDSILLGGAMVYTFMRAQGYQTGKSLVEEGKIEIAGKILKDAESKGVEILLPADHILADEMDASASTSQIPNDNIPDGLMGVDIGSKTIRNYSERIANAQTIVWNGPLGVFEIEPFSKGTIRIAETVAQSSAVSIVGGGDSASAVAKAGVRDRIDHISTGGGASLDLLAGKELPGLAVLTDKKA